MRADVGKVVLLSAFCAVAAGGAACSQRDDMQARVVAALAAESRPAADKDIDADRKPVEVLRFFGIEEGMTVLDVTAADGYYTELLAAAVGPNGIVYAQNDPGTLTRRDGAVDQALTARLANARLPNVIRIDADVQASGLSSSVDAALVILTIHDFYNFQGEEAALTALRGVHAALKPGGILGLIDHAGDAGNDNRTLHRIEKAVVDRLIAEAGFVVDADSSLLANPADDHTVGVFDPSIRRKTDRFVIRALKLAN
jgi:predicted methyltransferase